jgi:AraC-like DNA-binding protein
MSALSQLPKIDIGMVLGSERLPPPRGPVRLDLGGIDTSEAPAVLQHCFARLGFRYDLQRLPGMPFAASLALNALPGMLIAEGRLHGTSARRRSFHVQDDTDILMLVNRRGTFLVEQFGRQEMLGDGEAILVSGADPSVLSHGATGEMLALRMSRDLILPLLRGGTGALMRRIPAGTPALDLLKRYVGLTWEAASHDTRGLMAAHLRDLAAAAAEAGAPAASGGLRAARLHAVKQDIADRIGEPDLNLASVADRHHLTPRSLQRLFESEGSTFSRHLLATRLAAAHRLLSGPRAGKISADAYACGFGDLSYFNRAFRRQFGLAPSDIRAGESYFA